MTYSISWNLTFAPTHRVEEELGRGQARVERVLDESLGSGGLGKHGEMRQRPVHEAVLNSASADRLLADALKSCNNNEIVIADGGLGERCL